MYLRTKSPSFLGAAHAVAIGPSAAGGGRIVAPGGAGGTGGGGTTYNARATWGPGRGRGLRRRSRGRLRGLGNLGADLTQYLSAATYLRQANQELIALEQGIAQYPSMAAAINDARNRYQQLLQYYIMAYQTATGAAPDVTGLQGLGQWQTYLVAGAGIAVIVAGVIELEQYIHSVLQPQAQAALTQAQAAQTAQTTASAATTQAIALQNQAAQAAAAGDTATATSLTAQANALLNTAAAAAGSANPPPPGSTSFGDWISANWPWLAAAVAGLVVLQDL